ncbi:hypothetical protein [Plantactinospora sp. GCM10030261]|uniref:hypothetical protein n=1 Tax=Plantactinospora sp. GCM10030261 TaxID=3273420 RepID=UPI003623DCD9
MTQLLAAAVAVLTALVLLNLALTLAMMRRLREVSTMHATHGNSGSPALPAPGHPVSALPPSAKAVGDLAPPDVSGGSHLVAVISPTCPPCQDLADQIAGWGPDGPIDLVLLVGEADQPEVAGLIAGLRGLAPVVTVLGDDLEAGWGVTGFPALLRVTDGSVAAAGHRLSDLGERAPAGESLVAGRAG